MCILAADAGFYTRLACIRGQSGFYYSENILTREQIKSFWENASDDAKKEIQDITLFRESKGKLLKNEDLGHDSEVKLIETAGNMNLITPDRLRAGAYVTDCDLTGCVVSKETADSLFGSYEVTGNQVILGEDAYTIRGVVDVDGQLCMIQGREGRQYSGIRVEAPGIPMSVVRQRLAGIIREDQGWTSECDLYLGIAEILLYLPLWIVLIRLLGMAVKIIPKSFHFMMPVAGFAGVCGLLLLSLHFSDDYIPSAWSDFTFWAQLFDEKKNAFLALLAHPLNYADGTMLGNAAGLLLTTLIICMILKNICINKKNAAGGI